MKISARDIRVNFGGVVALAGVDLDINRGEIVGLLGPNGAGKTTLFNCITGVVKPSGGQVSVNGTDVSNVRLDVRVRLGLSRTFQTPRVDLHGSVLDTVMLGFTPHVKQSWLGSFFGSEQIRRQEATMRLRAIELIEELGIATDPNKRAGDLSLGTLRLLEVARALAAEPDYLLLDEPAAGMDDRDIKLLMRAIRDATERGVGVLVVEHNVPFVAELSQRLVGMVQGQVVAAGDPKAVLSDTDFVRSYIGGASL